MTPRTAACLLAATLLPAACAHVPADPAGRAEYERTNDPAEPTNCRVFAAKKNSLDDYATLRSISAQRRAAVVEEGRAGSAAVPGDGGRGAAPAGG